MRMDHDAVLRALAMAERYIAEGKRHIRHQREIIQLLASGGHDTTAAEALMRQFEEVQALRIADRDRLLKLAARDDPPS